MQGFMTQTSSSTIFNFSTLDFPKKDRFNIWVRDNHCDCRLRDSSLDSFDAEATGAALGPLILSGRKWLREGQAPAYEVLRSDRRIRTDGHDFFRFTLVLDGRFIYRSMGRSSIKAAGDLFILDAAQVNDCVVETSEVLSVAVPRDLLPSQTALLHAQTLTGGAARLLADHIVSLFRNLPLLKAQEIPYLVQSTLQLLTAVVSSTGDAMQEAAGPIRELLLGRVLRYLDTHLLDADLTPDRICRDVGFSRAKLYQLFEGHGGVMRQIQRKRLYRAYQLLADPGRPRPHIAELAWSHGFPNDKYFYRLFKAEFGHTPGETLENMSRPEPPAKPVSTHQLEERVDRPSGWTLPFGVPDN
jgi:AraC-like DNA-binding protein